MNTNNGCKIGKVTIKNTGVTLERVEGTNLTVISKGDRFVEFGVAQRLAELINTGDVSAAAIIVVKRDGSVTTEFNVDAGHCVNGLLGGLERLKESILRWLRSD